MVVFQNKDRLTTHFIELLKLIVGVMILATGLIISLTLHISSHLSDLITAVPVIIFVGAAAILLFDVAYIRVDINRNGKSRVIAQKLHTRKIIEFSVSDIKAVRKKEYVGMGNGSHAPNDLLLLIIKGTKPVSIAWHPRGLTFSKPYRKAGQKIADYVGVPLEIKQINFFK